MTSLKYQVNKIFDLQIGWTKLFNDFCYPKMLSRKKKPIIVRPIHSSLRSESKIRLEEK